MKKTSTKTSIAQASLPGFSFTDQELEAKVEEVQRRADKWVRALRPEKDCWGFKSFDEHYSKDEPHNPPIALIMHYDSEKVMRSIDAKWESFSKKVLEGTGFEAEPYDHVSMHFVPEKGPIQDAFSRYYRF